MIQAGIFDIGGVLVDPGEFEVLLDLLIDDLNVSSSLFHSFWKEHYRAFITGKLTEDQFWTEYERELHLKRPQTTESLFVTEYKKIFKRIDITWDVLNQLKSNGLKLAILSNMIEPQTKYLRSIGITDAFDVAVFSSEVGLKKPDPKIYELALQELSVSPEEAFFVDDKEKNTDAAKNLGIKSITFRDPHALASQLQELGISL